MKRLQAYKFELMPNGGQQRMMRFFAGSCRFVYNKALGLQKENYFAGHDATVSQCGGKWFVSIQTQREVSSPALVSTSAIGIDVGIARFATMSDERYVALLNSFKKH